MTDADDAGTRAGPPTAVRRLGTLLAALNPATPPPTPREIAELIWLAGTSPHPAADSETPAFAQPPPSAAQQHSPRDGTHLESDSDSDARGRRLSATTRLYLPGSDAAQHGGEAGAARATAVRVTGAAALPRRRELARALRPLKRHVPSTTRAVLDEDATAGHIADHGLWMPVLTPAEDRWLNITLVLDTHSESAPFWEPLAWELHTLLQRLGAFRDVRFHYLRPGDGKSARLGPPAATRRSPTFRSTAAAVDPTGRTITLVLTDGVSPAWRTPVLRAPLRAWAETGPAAILQTLPEHLWGRTALSPVPVRFRSTEAGSPNSRLGYTPYGIGPQSRAGGDVPVPVLGITPEWLTPWARAVAGIEAFDGAAVLLPASESISESPSDDEPHGSEERNSNFDDFRANAAPAVFRLASYLAAAPLNLPVMRVIQSVMSPDSPPSHLAEIVFSGLLRRVPGSHDDASGQAYEFVPGVRQRLLSTIRRDEVNEVIAAVSAFVGRNRGATGSRFTAAAADLDGPLTLPAKARHWAEIHGAGHRNQAQRVQGMFGDLIRRGTPAAEEVEFNTLIRLLAAFRNDRLGQEPSHQILARAAGVSPSTIGAWLRGDRFPQRIESLLEMLQAIQVRAERAGIAKDDGAVALLDQERWVRAYRAEAQRRADTARTTVKHDVIGDALQVLSPPGRPLSEMTDPFYLEVHRAIDSNIPDLPVLPQYVPRAHDRLLGEIVNRATSGSQLAVLVGGASTGKTRACWEALHMLRRLRGWRLWHPIDPSRAEAALAGLGQVGPRTVVWLNEAQFYLADPELGERVAAELRQLLRDTGRAPVLVLATLRPEQWATLTTSTDPDLHAQARQLLTGHEIDVASAFTGPDFDALADTVARDPRLREAARLAHEGQITQYLAGVPVMMERYRAAPPAARALIHAAMDARRLGCGPRLPLALLTDAIPGYLTGHQRDQAGKDWLWQALAYTAEPCNGMPGILTAVRTGPVHDRHPGRVTEATPRTGRYYRLADHLVRVGRATRGRLSPPEELWNALAEHAESDDLPALSSEAQRRKLPGIAAKLMAAVEVTPTSPQRIADISDSVVVTNKTTTLRSESSRRFWLNGEMHCPIMFADIVRFSDLARTDSTRRFILEVTNQLLRESFDNSGVRWSEVHWEDRGDGGLIVMPPLASMDALIDPLLLNLAWRIRSHNRQVQDDTSIIKLRVSLHVGPVLLDEHGVTGDSVIHAARLLDAREFKERLAGAGAELGFITSQHVYDSMSAMSRDRYEQVAVHVKESSTVGWIRILPGRESGHSLGAAELTRRELQIAALISIGHTDREIAERLSISNRTVRAHVRNMYAKLGVISRVGLVNALEEDATRSARTQNPRAD